MSHKITINDLRGLLGRLQRETGAPEMKWTPRADGKGSQCPVGAYLINPGSQTNGHAWALAQMVSSDGAEHTILRARTARELYHMMHAYMDGMGAARRVQP